MSKSKNKICLDKFATQAKAGQTTLVPYGHDRQYTDHTQPECAKYRDDDPDQESLAN